MWNRLSSFSFSSSWMGVRVSIHHTVGCCVSIQRCFSSCLPMANPDSADSSHASWDFYAEKFPAFLLSFDVKKKKKCFSILPVYLMLRPPSACLAAMLWLCWPRGFQLNTELHGSHPTCASRARWVTRISLQSRRRALERRWTDALAASYRWASYMNLRVSVCEESHIWFLHIKMFKLSQMVAFEMELSPLALSVFMKNAHTFANSPFFKLVKT